LSRAGQSRNHHVGLQKQTLHHHALHVELIEDGVQNFLCDLAASRQGMRAVHEHFRLDDGNQPRFLTQRGVARECVRIGLDATSTRNAVAYGNHRAPFRETCPHRSVFSEARTQAIQAFGHFLSRVSSEIFLRQYRL
jgi:hypothetical protein